MSYSMRARSCVRRQPARQGPDRRRGREGSTMALRSKPTAGRQLPPKDPDPFGRGSTLPRRSTPTGDGCSGHKDPFKILEMRPEIHEQRARGWLASVDLASDPSPPYRNQRARQQVGHGVSSGRSTREAGAPRFPETALRTDCGASRYSGDVRLVMQTAPGTFGTTLTSGHRAPPCTPRSMLGR